MVPLSGALPCPCCLGVFLLVELEGDETAIAHTLPACQGVAELPPGAFLRRAAAGLLGAPVACA